jgi:hypothetical protein
VGWTDIYDLPPYEHRCALLCLDTLVKRRSIACIMFIFDILGGRMNSPNLFSALDLNTPRYRTRGSEFLRIGFHRARTTGFMNWCLPQCASLTRLLVCSVSFCPVISLWPCMPTQLFVFLRISCALHVLLYVPGPSYRLTYSVDVIVASSTHCRDRNYPLLVSFFILYVSVCALCL